VDDGGNALTEK